MKPDMAVPIDSQPNTCFSSTAPLIARPACLWMTQRANVFTTLALSVVDLVHRKGA
jgi:hypothetical protein